MSLKPHSEHRFFLTMGCVLLVLVIAGFLPGALQRLHDDGSLPLHIHLHGIALLAWYVLFTVQAYLVGSARLAIHMRLGQLSVLLAIAMIVLAYVTIRGAYASSEFSIAGLNAQRSVMFPFTDMVNFSIVFALGLRFRHVAATHKRCMLLAGMLMLDPAVARLVLSIGAPPPMILGVHLLLLGALLTYDVRSRGRPHWVSMMGLGLFIMAMLAKVALSATDAWASFVVAVFA